MKKDEVFDIRVKFQNQLHHLTVKTDYPAGPCCLGWDYAIYDGRKHLYTLSQCSNDDDIACWEVKKKPRQGHDPVLVERIGKAIDLHYK